MRTMVVLSFITLSLVSLNVFSLPSFPGAEGYGADNPGGRGGQVIHVTNLQPMGEGSFAWALGLEFPRIIVFDVSGVIDFKGKMIDVGSGNVTIAGQTSPGGITLKNTAIMFGTGEVDSSRYARNLIARHLRVRGAVFDQDCFSVYGGKNVILDHISAAWSCDETMSVTWADMVTIQWSNFEESCMGCAPESGHNYGGHIAYTKAGTRFSLHHNMYTHHWKRVPEILTGYVDVRNCVIYDDQGGVGSMLAGEGQRIKVNMIGNYYKFGPGVEQWQRNDFADRYGNSSLSMFWIIGPTDAYLSGNILEGFENVTQTQMVRGLCDYNVGLADGCKCIVDSASQLNERCKLVNKCEVGSLAFNNSDAPVTTYPAKDAYTLVLAKSGAFPRDRVTEKYVNDARNGTGGVPKLDCSGGFPGDDLSLPGYEKPQDSDNDGMSDVWEDSLGLKKGDSSDCSLDMDGDGYTNIEEYINMLADKLMVGTEMSVLPQASGNSAGLHQILVYPNPCAGAGLFAICLSSVNGGVVDGLVEIHDFSGRIVFSTNAADKVLWSGRDYRGNSVSAGIYLVKWKSQGQLLANKKMVVIF